jgi:hypothetical protein
MSSSGLRRATADAARVRRPDRRMGLHRALLGAAALVGLALPASAPAQRVIEIRDCLGACELTVRLQATLGDEREALVSDNYTLQRTADGRFLFSSYETGGQILVFDSAGAHVGAAGRRGRGPGEYVFVDRLVVAGERVHAFDLVARRRTVLDHALEPVRMDGVPFQALSVAVLHDTLTVVNMAMPSPERIGYLLHVLGEDASILRSMERQGQQFPFTSQQRRRLARLDGRRFLSAHASAYRIDEWSADGDLLATWTREVPWFQSYETRCCIVHPDEPPQAMLRDIRVDADGRLWTLVTVPDARWQSVIVEDPMHGYRYTDVAAFYDTIIEVIDLRTGRVIGSARLDPFMGAGFAGDGITSSFRLDERRMAAFIDVWRVQIPDPEARR